MSRLVLNRDGGKTDEFGHLLGFARQIQGEVIEGLLVAAQGSPNMSVAVPYGSAAIPTGSGASAYRYFVAIDSTENVTITTANGSNPRNDLIVLYVDKVVTPNTSNTNNSNNMLKLAAVAGTPAATPADPNTAAIQAAIGAANPYIILARVRVNTSATQITSGNITDLRSLTGISRMLADQVTTSIIANDAITTGKLANLAVTNAKLAASAVDSSKIDWAVATGKVWWEELGRATLTTPGDTITVNFTAKRYLRIIFMTSWTTNTITAKMRYNNDSGNNYAYRVSRNGVADGTAASQSSIGIIVPAAGERLFITADVLNVDVYEKQTQIMATTEGTAGAGNPPNRNELIAKYVSPTNAAITSVTVFNDVAGDFNANGTLGTQLIVLGHD